MTSAFDYTLAESKMKTTAGYAKHGAHKCLALYKNEKLFESIILFTVQIDI